MHKKNRALRGAVVAGVATRYIAKKLLSEPDWIPEQWRKKFARENHRQQPVSLYEGPAIAAGLAVGALAAGASARTKTAAALTIAGAGIFGVIDDIAETTDAKGIRGHLGSLARGQLTTGGLKILGIGASALAAAAVARKPRQGVTDVVLNGTLIAASANLGNLFDLRPGRVLKVAAATSFPLAVCARESGVAGAVIGSALAAAPEDLAEETMAGDGGANALGAAVGAAVAFGANKPVRIMSLATVIGLTLASEKWSFSKFIAARPWLHAIDSWGRRR